MTRPKPLHKDAEAFVAFHLGKRAFAPFTGTDSSAWVAFVYLVRCWCQRGCEKNDLTVEAMRWTLLSAQRSVYPLFLQAIPAVADWGHADKLWPALVTGTCLEDTVDARPVRREE